MSLNFWHGVDPGAKIPETVNVIIEIPRGSHNKYEYDKDNNLIKLDRVLFSPFHYPADYGIIPQTLAEDGDPLDALVLLTNPGYPGVLVEVRPIGILAMKDGGKNDDKILSVARKDPRFSGLKEISDVEDHILKEIAHFFQVYKELEGKKVEVLGWKNAREAKSVIMSSVRLYKKRLAARSK